MQRERKGKARQGSASERREPGLGLHGEAVKPGEARSERRRVFISKSGVPIVAKHPSTSRQNLARKNHHLKGQQSKVGLSFPLDNTLVALPFSKSSPRLPASHNSPILSHNFEKWQITKLPKHPRHFFHLGSSGWTHQLTMILNAHFTTYPNH